MRHLIVMTHPMRLPLFCSESNGKTCIQNKYKTNPTIRHNTRRKHKQTNTNNIKRNEKEKGANIVNKQEPTEQMPANNATEQLPVHVCRARLLVRARLCELCLFDRIALLAIEPALGSFKSKERC